MQIRVEDVSPVEKKLLVEVPWPTVQTKLGDAYRELAKGVNLKGFRKGKVPRSVLERMFGKQVRAEVVSQLVRESFLTAASEHNLQPVSEPIVEETGEIRAGKPFSFAARIEVKGDFQLGDIDGLELTCQKIVVPEVQVDEALSHLQRESVEELPIEGRDVTARTDIVRISIKGKLGDHDVDLPELAVDLTDPDSEPVPGLVAALTGLPINASDHPINLQMPDDHPSEDLRGAAAAFTISITDARRKVLPELDDEFAKDTGRAESLDQLREVLRADLEARAAERRQAELRESALRALVKANQIPLAPSLIERAVQMRRHQLQSMLGGAGVGDTKLEDLFAGEAGDRLRDGAADELRGQLLLDALITEHEIQVSDEEIDAHLTKLGKVQGLRAQRLRAELDRDGKLENIVYRLRSDKALDLLVSRAKISEVEEAVEETVDAEPLTADADAEAGETTTQTADSAATEDNE